MIILGMAQLLMNLLKQNARCLDSHIADLMKFVHYFVLQLPVEKGINCIWSSNRGRKETD
jgi:hypothetical protein